MQSMFQEVRNFNYDIGGWDVGQVKNMEAMFALNSSFRLYNELLIGWSQLPSLQNNVKFTGDNLFL